MTENDRLTETLREAQRFGFFGERAIPDAIEHARDFVRALDDLRAGDRVLDLGSGGGLPGLVLAVDRPDLSVVLLDRRQKRTDFLERAVRRLGLEHVAVWARDANDVVADVGAGVIDPFAAVTARGFGPPELTLRTAVACAGPGGVVVVSEPPGGDRWPPALLDELGRTRHVIGAVARFD